MTKKTRPPTLTREEMKAKRAQVNCPDYSPLPREVRCQHYVGKGACGRDDYFMCVEWLRKNPDKAATLSVPQAGSDARVEQLVQSAATLAESVDEEVEQRIAQSVERPSSPRKKHLRTIVNQEPSPPPKAKANKGKLFDLKPLLGRDKTDRPLLEKPELLTPAAVAALTALGVEVTVNTNSGKELALVPNYTDSERPELSFRDARTLVTLLQVFPGATIESIRKPPTDEEAS